MQKDKIKPGFKNSSIGPVPSDWKVKNINEVFYFKQGVQCAPENQNITRSNGQLRFIRIIDLTNSAEPIRYIDDPGKDHHIKTNDIFMVRYGTPGLLGFGYEGVIANNLFRLIPKIETINSFYFYQLYLKERQIIKLASSSTMPALNFDSLSQLKLLVPPLNEQQKIAAILSTWDDAISKTQQLINQFKQRNNGLQQQLLSGKKRLKGFNSTWKYERISSIAKEVSIKNKEDKILTVLSCTKYNGLVPSLEYFGRKIFADDLTTYKVAPKHHFAYATNHIEEGSIGLQSEYEEALISPMYTVFKTDISLFDNTFLFKVLKSHNYIHEYQKRMEGSIDRRGGLRWDEFSKIKIPAISLDEQRPILNILNLADNEVKIQEQKLEALKQQKKGLMQQLLTGIKRVTI